MYYVSDIVIINSGEKLNSVTYWPLQNVPHFDVELTDLETGKKRMAKSYEVGELASIGYGKKRSWQETGLSSSVPSEVVVKHSLKTALLHKYVLEARSLAGTALIDGIEMDTFVYGNHIAHGGANVVGVDSTSETFLLCGGVVIKRRGFDGIRFTYTLYEALGELCRECQSNLMAYERIFIFSLQHNVTTEIRLAQTEEAQRFFTKMYLDVMCK